MLNTTGQNEEMPADIATWYWIVTYIFPLIYLPTGIVGNTLCILIMLRQENIKNSVCNYMLALAIADLIYTFVVVYFVVLSLSLIHI